MKTLEFVPRGLTDNEMYYRPHLYLFWLVAGLWQVGQLSDIPARVLSQLVGVVLDLVPESNIASSYEGQTEWILEYIWIKLSKLSSSRLYSAVAYDTIWNFYLCSQRYLISEKGNAYKTIFKQILNREI